MFTKWLTYGVVVVQGTLLVMLLLIFNVILPMQGVYTYADISNPARFMPAQATIYLVVWIQFFFALSWGILTWGMFDIVRRRLRLVPRYFVATLLAASVAFFILHDWGFQIYQWQVVVADPADHAFGMDMLLLNVRNGIWFFVGVVTVIDLWRKPQPQQLASVHGNFAHAQ